MDSGFNNEQNRQAHTPVATPMEQPAPQTVPQQQPVDSVQQPIQPVYAQVPAAYYYAPFPPEQSEKVKRVNTKLGEAASSVNLGVLSFIAVVFGAVTSNLIIRGGFGFGATITTVLLYALLAVFILRKGRKPSLSALFIAIPTLVISVSLSLFSSLSGRFWMVVALLGLSMLLSTLLGSCTESSALSTGAISDSLYTHCALPFRALGACSKKNRHNSAEQDDKKKPRSSGSKVVIGLLIAVPIMTIVFALFCLADAAFRNVAKAVIDYLEVDIGKVIVDLIIGLIIALYAVPTIVGLRSGYYRERIETQRNRPLDPVIWSTVVFATAAIYICFVLVQIRYFFAGTIADYFGYDFKTGLALPSDMTWAEYARSGFFELSGIIIATFIVVILISRFSKLNDKGRTPKYLSAALTLISVCNFIIIVSAILRMLLYTKWCGLTGKRIGVLLTIGVIAISLVVLVIKLWNDKINAVRAIIAVSIVAIAVFSCMNVDKLCADVNVSRHIDQGTSIDMEYLNELSVGAAPAVERLMNESPDKNIQKAAKGLLAIYMYDGNDSYPGNFFDDDIPFGAMTFDIMKAKEICGKYKLKYSDRRYYYGYNDYIRDQKNGNLDVTNGVAETFDEYVADYYYYD